MEMSQRYFHYDALGIKNNVGMLVIDIFQNASIPGVLTTYNSWSKDQIKW